MSNFQNPSATATRKTESFNLQVARGHVSNHSAINKFGWNSSVGGSFETVWDGSNVYTYQSSGTATAVSTTDADDSASTVRISGLDANFLPATDLITVDGSASANSYSRINRAIVVSANTSTTNSNSIEIRQGGEIAALITAGAGQTLMAVYTVPAGKTGYLHYFQGSIDKQKEVIFRILARDNDAGTAFNEKGRFGSFGVPVDYTYDYPLKFSANTDIQVQVKAGATTEAGAIFDMVLIDGADTIVPGTGVS
jgi:hypothetical protein